jgi:hypothetical protein
MMMNRFQNQFAILDETQINKMRPMKPQRSRKRKRCDFPKLSDTRITPLKDQLPYAKLIPSLTEIHIKTLRAVNKTHDNYKNYQNDEYDTGYESGSDILNQVWCVEKNKSTVFESDMYSDIESNHSFVYESDSYSYDD